MTISGNEAVYGARIPGIWTLPKSTSTGYLHIAFASSGNRNYYVNTKVLPVNKWVKVRLSQQLEGSQYIYKIFINDKQVLRRVNTQPRDFRNVKVYAGDPWYQAAEGYIRNLDIYSKCIYMSTCFYVK